MGLPIARVGDMQTCPMTTGSIPHVGGAIVGPGCSTVLVDSLTVSIVGDTATLYRLHQHRHGRFINRVDWWNFCRQDGRRLCARRHDYRWKCHRNVRMSFFEFPQRRPNRVWRSETNISRIDSSHCWPISMSRRCFQKSAGACRASKNARLDGRRRKILGCDNVC